MFAQTPKTFEQRPKMFNQSAKTFEQRAKMFGQSIKIVEQKPKMFGQSAKTFEQRPKMFAQRATTVHTIGNNNFANRISHISANNKLPSFHYPLRCIDEARSDIYFSAVIIFLI